MLVSLVNHVSGMRNCLFNLIKNRTSEILRSCQQNLSFAKKTRNYGTKNCNSWSRKCKISSSGRRTFQFLSETFSRHLESSLINNCQKVIDFFNNPQHPVKQQFAKEIADLISRIDKLKNHKIESPLHETYGACHDK